MKRIFIITGFATMVHSAHAAPPQIQETQWQGDGLKVYPVYDNQCYYIVKYSSRLDPAAVWEPHHITTSRSQYHRFFQEDSKRGFYVVEERNASNPSDTDADGINDIAEINGGTNPFNGDSDGDGSPDLTDQNPTIPDPLTVIVPFGSHWSTSGATGFVASLASGTLPEGLWRISNVKLGGALVGPGAVVGSGVDNFVTISSGGQTFGLLKGPWLSWDDFFPRYTGQALSGSYEVKLFNGPSDSYNPAQSAGGEVHFEKIYPVEVVIRSFIPSAYVEAPLGFPVSGDWAVVGSLSDDIVFKGDNRSFEYAAESYRTEHRFLLMPHQESDDDGLLEESKDIGTTFTYQKSSSVVGDQLRQEAREDQIRFAPFMVDFDTGSTSDLDFEVLRVNEKAVKLRATCAAGNPLFSELVVPDIDYDFTLTIDASSQGYLWCTIQGCHDGFPSYEIYVNGRLVLGAAARGSLLNLHGGVYLGFCIGADQVGSYGVWAPKTPPASSP